MNANVPDAVSALKAAKLEKLLKLCQEKFEQGAMQAEIIVFLHTQKLDLDSAIQIFRGMFGGSFWENARLFHNHAEWREDVEHTEKLSKEFIECFFSEDETKEKDSEL